MKTLVFPLAAAALLTGCLYADIRSPRAYRSASPSEVKASAADELVQGVACNHFVLYLVAWGKGGYAEATRKALEGRPEAVLYDVKTDIKVKAYLLGLYARTCTSVTGKAGRL